MKKFLIILPILYILIIKLLYSFNINSILTYFIKIFTFIFIVYIVKKANLFKTIELNKKLKIKKIYFYLIAPVLGYGFYLFWKYFQEIIVIKNFYTKNELLLRVSSLFLVLKKAPYIGTTTFIMIISLIIFATIEEILMRKMVYGSLRKKSIVFAMILSSLIFTFAHTIDSYGQLTNIFLFGIFLSFFYEISGDIIVSILIHFTYNFSVLYPTIFK
ncbi:hypothetical protein OSSY52_12720 [Tepiditoga spiralis]|uniref:CAAX prenyl protease 2/Lysostaphin resistance protein A-like domain-containing protein n=1 Tax=Tepiditoga spiralis TaxID=2108365 RepID=A0A7G1G460_9BACT|nr:CPBP family intramembrane glutamic endopeptidase [Tepiditoga spiralis]BBE31131.1 hypothetical protein OSSY52_12720 [Tepiditoga spiralis]